MDFFITFLEGLITFISPCLLPMLPIYFIYFAGDSSGEAQDGHPLPKMLAFVAGFTTVFVALGAFAGSLGQWFKLHERTINIATGLIVIYFGLCYLGVFRNPLQFLRVGNGAVRMTGLPSAFLFGAVLSASWLPCAGVFLGSALMLASHSRSATRGMLLLLCYSAGLGIPFVLCGLLLDRAKQGFDFIKRHYGLISKVCGAFLVCIGGLMATGMLGRWLVLFSV